MNSYKREINALMKIDHPNVVKLYEVFEDANFLNIVTEYCGGGELYERIN